MDMEPVATNITNNSNCDVGEFATTYNNGDVVCYGDRSPGSMAYIVCSQGRESNLREVTCDSFTLKWEPKLMCSKYVLPTCSKLYAGTVQSVHIHSHIQMYKTVYHYEE